MRPVETVVERWGRLDVLVNNAGAGAILPLADAGVDQIRAIFAVNVIGPSLLARAALHHLNASGGAIVNVSSTFGHKAAPALSVSLGRRGTPEHVAPWIVALAATDAGWVTGQVITVDGGRSVT